MIFKYTILYVDQVVDTITFYETAFGFARGFVHEAEDYGELVTGDTKLAFSSTKLMSDLGKNPSKPDPDAPAFELAFETENVGSALEKAVAAGAILVQDARQEPWGQTTAYVTDPNGYLIEICSPVQLPSAG